MLDRVYTCPRCGEADTTTIISVKVDLDSFGCGLALLCDNCYRQSWIVLDWELSYRLLRRRLSLRRIRTRVGASPWSWRPIMSFDTLGLSELAAVRKQVAEIWDWYIVGALETRPRSIYYWNSAERSDLRVLLHALQNTSGGPDSRAWTVRDFLGLAHEIHADECFG